MEDYKKMYLHLFNETTKAIEILKKAQCECEDMFINFEESPQETQKKQKQTQ